MGILSWLNPLNAIIGVAGAYVNKKQDVDLEKYKVNGQISVAAIQADTAIIAARSNHLSVAIQYFGHRAAQYLFIYPTGIWFALVMYDSAFRNILPVGWTWRVLAPPDGFEYYLYGVFAYLFATAWAGRK